MTFCCAESHGRLSVSRPVRGVSRNVHVSERVARGRNVRVSERDDQKLRALFYACKLYAGSLKKGKQYKTAPSVYQIFLVDFDLFGEDGKPGGRKFYHRAMMRLDDGLVFADRLQILFFDLSVPGAVSKDLKNAANWCKFIAGCTNPEVLEKLGRDESWKEDYKMALKAYMKIAAEERAWAYHLSTDRAEADYRNGLILAEERGRENGEKKGERTRALAIAKNMLAMGLGTPVQIAQVTGLPLEEVEKLAAGQGNAAAQYNLGLMYRKGNGVEQDYADAVTWVRKADGRVELEGIPGEGN